MLHFVLNNVILFLLYHCCFQKDDDANDKIIMKIKNCLFCKYETPLKVLFEFFFNRNFKFVAKIISILMRMVSVLKMNVVNICQKTADVY